MCEATAGWTTNQAVTGLKQTGTAADYVGLYRSSMDFRLPEAAALARIVELPEVAKTSWLVGTMVAIDGAFDRLKAAQKARWLRIPHQPDLTPAPRTYGDDSLGALPRTCPPARTDTAKRPDDYRTKLSAAEKATDQFRALLRDDQTATAERDTSFQAVDKTCATCHKQHRN